jgi:hypothetical protein
MLTSTRATLAVLCLAITIAVVACGDSSTNDEPALHGGPTGSSSPSGDGPDGSPSGDGSFATDDGGGQPIADGSAPGDGGGGSDGVAPDAPPSKLAIVRSFDGESGGPGAGCVGAPSGCGYRDHPDMGIAVSGSQVVEATGQSITVWDYNGKQLAKTDFPTFLKNAGVTPGTIADPRIAYDPFIQRFLVTCSCSNDFLVVSGSQDATGAWKGVALGQGNGDLTMFPGWDKNGVYISQYGGSINNYTVVALPPADVAWTGSGTISLSHMNVFTNKFAFEARPASDPNPGKQPGAPAYFVARAPGSGNVAVDALTWSGTTATQQAQKVVSTGAVYSTPPASMAQPSGPGVRPAESHRIFSAMMSGSHVHSVLASGPCASGCGPSGPDTHMIFYWFDIDTSSMTLANKAKVSSPTLDYTFPVLAVTSSGDVGITASAMSSSTYPEIVLFSHRTTDGANALTGPVIAVAGTQSYACVKNPVGWGTFAMSVQDPGDPGKIWAVQQYGASATACQWQTRLIQFQP